MASKRVTSYMNGPLDQFFTILCRCILVEKYTNNNNELKFTCNLGYKTAYTNMTLPQQLSGLVTLFVFIGK